MLLLAHADIRFTSAESEQPETQTHNHRSVPESSTVVYRLINNGIFVGISITIEYRMVSCLSMNPPILSTNKFNQPMP